MAVMTSLPHDGVELEQKTQPVPSSDKMALDLDINGTSTHDEATRDTAHPDFAVTANTDLLPKHGASESVEINGAHNVAAVEANSFIPEHLDLPDAPAVSQPFPTNMDVLTAVPDFDTEIDTSSSLATTNVIKTSTPQDNHETGSSRALSDELLAQASEIPPAATAVLPIIEAQESDLRDEILPEKRYEAADIMSEGQGAEKPADADQVTVHPSGLGDSAPLGQVGLSLMVKTPVEEQPLPSVSKIDLNQTSQTDLSPATPVATGSVQEDATMTDAPHSPAKVIREREEEDMEDGPSAKRTKTEADESAAATIATPQTPLIENGTYVASPGDELAPTPYQQKELLKVLKNVKGTSQGKQFRAAVVELWPVIKDSYLQKVTTPMDLSIVERRLKEGYPSLGAFKTDVNLIYNNTVLYNGTDHDVSRAGAIVRNSIFNKMPPPEPVKLEKKRKATPAAEPAPRAPPARRQSRGAAASASSPTGTQSAQTFALDPSGTPLIRRDSTKGEGGRPKREIHPPKSKDLNYSARPKKKKFAAELKFCEEVLNEIKKPKYHQYASPFLVPVDPVALGIPDYFKIIKSPMDLATVTSRFSNGQYESAKDFEADVKQIFKNCYKFNPVGSPVNEMGKAFEDVFDHEWSKKAQWIADHATSNAASPSSTVDSDEEESEEEEPEEVISSTSAIQERLIEEQNKLIGIMGAKKPDPVLIRMQQDMIGIIQKQMDSENAKKAKTKPKPKPAKKGSMSKKKAEPAKKAYRAKKIGIVEKEQISAGIVQLEGKLLDQAVAYLKMDYPNLNLDDETELDIDQFTDPTLSRLHDLIMKNVPGIVPAKTEPSRAAKPSKPKKNKPMSKTEQETKIEKLKKLQEQFDRQGSNSDDARGGRVVPSVEQDQSSGDESPSDSEED